MKIKISLGLIFILCGCCCAFAQNAQPATEVEGVVIEADGSRKPIDYAVVSLLPAELSTLTNGRGEFRFNGVEAGKATLRVQYVGYETIDTLVNIRPGVVNRFDLRMKVADFRMEEVVVTAQSNKAGQATASTISRQAIDHLQASSLKDVMQLIPGAVMSNTNLANPNMLSIRSIDGDAANSMGTALILDGAQQSNNANLQVASPTANGSTNSPMYYQDATAGNSAGGVDTRTIALDNVESVEVIRGIPSAEYGDLTAGAVIVKSKTGQTPLNVKFSARPEQYQGSVSKGFRLGEKGGTLNLNGDYLYAIKRPIESYWNYRRFTAGGIWSMRWNQYFSTKTTLNVHYGLDTRTRNPDNNASDLRESGQDAGVKFNTTGTLNINKGWFQSLEYGLAANYTDKHSRKSEIASNAGGLYSNNMVDGSIASNWPGLDISDIDGNPITNLLPGAEDAFIAFLPNTRYTRIDIYGREVYANARLKATFYKNWNDRIRNRIIVGAEFKTEGNLGKGKVYENESAPSPGSGFQSNRTRPYYDIPFIKQFSAYLEDVYQHSFGKHELIVSAGARFDHINGKNVLAPRINGSFTFADMFTVRGGYGITAKAPSLLYLYPENAYFDMPLYASVSSEDPNQHLVITKTNIYSAANDNLKIETNRKAEVGFDLLINKKYRLSATAYKESIRNGYSLSRGLDCFNLVEYPRYVVSQANPGSIPTLELENTYNVWQSFYRPSNTAIRDKMGVEVELDLGRFSAIRTSFYLSGAWMKESSSSNTYSYSENRRTGASGTELENNIGIYDKNRVVSYRERMVATLRMTHNIPRIGFVVTLTTQLTAMNKDWSRYNSDMFIKYLSKADGKVYDFDPAMKDDPEFSYLFPTNIPENREWAEKAIPTLFFNLTLTKEIGDYMRFSFFANNMFYSRPIYSSTRNRQSLIELGSDIFFGFDISFTIK